MMVETYTIPLAKGKNKNKNTGLKRKQNKYLQAWPQLRTKANINVRRISQ